ncbi:MAG TPA: fluoride efflux transporter CrcB [Actinomycetota bacterium]|nr:fluoride efflux transporter CrcB [Actinomycetota bacterium]
MSPLDWVGFVVAAAIGAPLRYLVDLAVAGRNWGVFPWGTLVINATGSFVLGALTGLALYHAFPAAAKVILGTGFCGAYTTFSTFTYETVSLIEEGAVATAFRSALSMLLAGALAAALGMAAAAL